MTTSKTRRLGARAAALTAFFSLLGAAPWASAQTCDNTCAYANDGECDDGGPGSMYALCGYGTDCGDCDQRSPLDPASTQAQRWAGGCDDSCGTARDGECDDGGPGSLYSVCRYGSDCGDCGLRNPIDPAALGLAASATGCDDSCASAFDNECDDGGPGSMYGLCPLGTDCHDCGARAPMHTGALPPAPRLLTPPPLAAGAPGCTDACRFAHDGECDDGGPGSLYNVCVYGTDCGDCGPRPVPGSGVAPIAPPPAPPVWTGSGSLCANSCQWANDGECDDGGPSSLYNVCEFGTDCGDCGPRSPGAPMTPPSPMYPVPAPPVIIAGPGCANTCQWANDGECDDGGPGSLYNVCEFGSDCGDCGPRGEVAAVPPGMPTPIPPSPGVGLCADSCPYAGDGACDDGGPSALSDICAYGTDCEDCGPRVATMPMPTPPSPVPPPTGIPQPAPRAQPAPVPLPDAALCTDQCPSANDGECDDGGPGAEFSVCGYGSDCADCGPRPPSAP